jgi:GntR family transcriptional regulator
MSIDPGQAKYAQIMNAIRSRIEHGTYLVGAKLPSEADLVREFGASRSTVVRALELLRQQGWLEGQQGVGRVVLGRPVMSSRRVPKLLLSLFDPEGAGTMTPLSAGPIAASQRAAAALGIPEGATVVARRRLATTPQLGPVELSTVYAAPDVAANSGLIGTAPVTENMLRHLARHSHVLCDHLAVQISARLPDPDEAALLKIDRRECVTTFLVSIRDRDAQPLFAVDAAIATRRRPLEAVFPAP